MAVRRLTEQEIETLGDMCLANARELLEDALVLHHYESYARAAALAVVAIEELGKRNTLWRAVNFGDNDEEWKLFWKRFRDHKTKSSLGNELIDRDSIEAAIWDDLHTKGAFIGIREAALYVDLRQDKPHQPSQAVSERLSIGLLGIAQKNLRQHESMDTRAAIEFAKHTGNRRPGETLVEWVTRTGMELPPGTLERIAAWDEEEGQYKKPYPPSANG